MTTIKSLAASLDTFTRAYLHAMYFTENPDPHPGECPEPEYGRMFSREVLEDAIRDCDQFRAGETWQAFPNPLQALSTDRHAGTDFWYTRNGHGTGFWDRKDEWPNPWGERLTDAAHAFGEYNVEYRRGRFGRM